MSDTLEHPWFKKKPLVLVVMGSKSDWEKVKPAVDLLNELGVPNDYFVDSAHRTPLRMFEIAKAADENGVEVIIAAAGGSAHLPGMTSALTPLPVLGIPVETSEFHGIDSMFSIGQMPPGVPVGMMPVGKAGPINAALLAFRIIAKRGSTFRPKLLEFIEKQTKSVPIKPD